MRRLGKNGNGNLLESGWIISETARDKENQAAKKGKLKKGYVREIEQRSFKKRNAKNPELIKENNKRTVGKRNA